MSSLRDLIAAKARRTATIPITVGAVAAAVAEVEARRAALVVHRGQRRDDEDETAAAAAAELEQQLQAAHDEAVARRNACVVLVQLQALPALEWDTALDGLPDDAESGLPDVSVIRAALVAACCIDPELQDEAFWAEQFAKPHWSKGELTSINMTLLQLNYAAPSADVGKG